MTRSVIFLTIVRENGKFVVVNTIIQKRAQSSTQINVTKIMKSVSAVLARRPVHLSPSQQVHVHVEDGLSSVPPRIDHETVAGVAESFLCRHLPSHGQ